MIFSVNTLLRLVIECVAGAIAIVLGICAYASGAEENWFSLAGFGAAGLFVLHVAAVITRPDE